ncbi:probable ribosomal large subunit pseudouridine synthase D [Coccomyxa sp. Obi]|nr:probable ribosomal large subunit pseudouridine synthase D [Coccomyxa sp. Obi]
MASMCSFDKEQGRRVPVDDKDQKARGIESTGTHGRLSCAGMLPTWSPHAFQRAVGSPPFQSTFLGSAPTLLKCLNRIPLADQEQQGPFSPVYCQTLRSETIQVAKSAALARTSSGAGPVQEYTVHVATDNASSSRDADRPFPGRGQQGSGLCTPPGALADRAAQSHFPGPGEAESRQRSNSQQGGRVREDHAVVASAVLPDGCAPVSLPQAVAELFPQHFPTATSAKRACRRGEILVDGIVSKLKYQRLVYGGQLIEWQQRMQGGAQLQPDCAPAMLQVVYEDEDIACVVKPPGMPTQGMGGVKDVVGSLGYLLTPSSKVGSLWRPQHVHRLDAPTGGLLMVAKTRAAIKSLSAAFAQREVKKTYMAIVGGRLDGRGSIEYPLDGKASLTEWVALGHTRSAKHGWITTVHLHPHTGRRHQLRRHMAMIGHPIHNDHRYTYGHAAQVGLCRSRKKQGGRATREGPCEVYDESACLTEAEAEECVAEKLDTIEAETDEKVEGNSAAVALERFGRAPASGRNHFSNTVLYTPPTREILDADELSAATAVQRLKHDKSAGPANGRGNATVRAALLPRPTPPQVLTGVQRSTGDLALDSSGGVVDTSDLCLWAVGISLTHPSTGELLNLGIEEPPLFEAVRASEFEAWRCK